tara:strand:- start:5631 stop:6593 length:963 start_codon:yes stop_codon:yes gene_type:complete
MIIDYLKFKKQPIQNESQLFVIHGNPRNISNEIEHDIINFFKKNYYVRKNYVVDDDSQTDSIKNDFYEQSLFDDKKLITINISSNSIPMLLKKFLQAASLDKSDNKILVKVDRQPSSFKITKFYKDLSKCACIIEVYELQGNVLRQWVKNKCKTYGLNQDDTFIDSLINMNMNNSLSISQIIYQRSFVKNKNETNNIQDSKYNEYDLVDTILNKDLAGFLNISQHLQKTSVSLPYLIFLTNSEIEKIYSIKNLTNKPYIPNFLVSKYNQAARSYDSESLLIALKKMIHVDINAKYNSKNCNSWVSFNDLFLNMMNNNVRI